MKILLLANQPEKTTRLKMFKGTLQELGYEIIVPKFDTRNWIGIARQAREFVKIHKPDVIHIFNVPDVVYHGLPKLKGTYFSKLIYDYRSPWGVEYGISFGPIVERVCEHFEQEMVAGADVITAPNTPLGRKALSYSGASGKKLYIIPNYPSRSFVDIEPLESSKMKEGTEDRVIIFVGRISKEEGIGNLLRLAKDMPDEKLWIVGDGPFAKWYLRNLPENVKYYGWQPHDMVGRLVSRANICLLPASETKVTPFATDKSVWKLNEYLSLGKIVIASGITKEEDRKNLMLVKNSELKRAVEEYVHREPEKMAEKDYRFWDANDRIIKEAYESLV